ncbi:MAG: hypothetical protein ACRDKI_00055 [Solirubrobacterales bacterium]
MKRFGLCDDCTHAKLIRNTRGSVFLMCTLSKTDERYPKYPRAPIQDCAGHKPSGGSRKMPE